MFSKIFQKDNTNKHIGALNLALTNITDRMVSLEARMTAWERKVMELSNNEANRKQIESANIAKKRQQQREYMKKYNARKKAEKLEKK